MKACAMALCMMVLGCGAPVCPYEQAPLQCGTVCCPERTPFVCEGDYACREAAHDCPWGDGGRTSATLCTR